MTLLKNLHVSIFDHILVSFYLILYILFLIFFLFSTNSRKLMENISILVWNEDIKMSLEALCWMFQISLSILSLRPSVEISLNHSLTLMISHCPYIQDETTWSFLRKNCYKSCVFHLLKMFSFYPDLVLETWCCIYKVQCFVESLCLTQGLTLIAMSSA